MSFKEEHTDKSIKSKMDNFEIAPPEEVWGNIEGALLKNKTLLLRNKIIGGVAGVVVLVSVFVAIFSFYKKNDLRQDNTEKQENLPAISNDVPDTVVSNNVSTRKEAANKKENVIELNNSNDDIILTEKRDTAIVEAQPLNAIVDTVSVNTAPAKKEVVKKVIKKPVYIVKQDTIYKVDTLSKKRKR